MGRGERVGERGREGGERGRGRGKGAGRELLLGLVMEIKGRSLRSGGAF